MSSLLTICSPTQATTKRALLVGISNYGQSGANSWNDIHGANDVELISKTLKKQDFIIITITNKNATARRIRKELKSLSNSCRKGDVVYISHVMGSHLKILMETKRTVGTNPWYLMVPEKYSVLVSMKEQTISKMMSFTHISRKSEKLWAQKDLYV